MPDPNHKGEQTARVERLEGLCKSYVSAILSSSTILGSATDPAEYDSEHVRVTELVTPILSEICRLGWEITEAAHAEHD
jgi:hypothetical protein